MVETCRQNQFMESYKTSLRSEKFWKMCLQKHLKKSGFFGRDHFCQFRIVCPKVIADSSYKIHQNPKQMWISSLFFQFQFQNDKKGAALEVVQTTFKKRGVAIIVRCCHAPTSVPIVFDEIWYFWHFLDHFGYFSSRSRMTKASNLLMSLSNCANSSRAV